MPTITGSCDNSRYILTCEYSFTQNVSTNASTITANVYLNGNGYTTSSSYWSCVINGTTVTSNKNASIGGKTLLGSKTWTVNHASDGTCKTNISFSYSNGLSSSGTYTTRTGSGNASVTLTTIPRASSFTLNRTSATIGSDAITVNISRASSSFTHTVIYKFGSITADQATKTTSTTVSFTPVLNDCNQIPNATSGTATIVVDTYNGNTKIGSSSKTITLNVPSSVIPAIGSVTANGNNLLGNIYVAGKSTVTAKINNVVGAYGSTIKSYTISGGHINSSTSSATSPILGAGSYTITGKVTDSRGRTASKSTSITVHSYYAPSLSIDLYRCNSDGTRNDSGTYVRVYINQATHNIGNANVNVKQYRIEWKTTATSNWTIYKDWTNINKYDDKWTHDLGGGWNNTVTYDVRVSIKDSYNTVIAVASVGTLSCLFNIEKDGIGVGKVHERGALDVGGKIYSTDSIITDNGMQIGKNKSYYGLDSESNQVQMLKVASHGGVDVGNSGVNTAICSANVPTWWNGTNSQTIYTTGNKPSPQDISAMKTVNANGYYGMTANGDEGNWVRTTKNGIIPYQSGTNASLGTSSWIFAKAYIDYTYTNEIKSTASSKSLGLQGYGNVWITTGTSGDTGTIWIQSPTMKPHAGNTTNLGDNTYKWKAVYSNNGTIQTSDERFKVKQGYVNTEDCFEMVKDIKLYNYIMLDKNKETLSRNRLGKLAIESIEDDTKVHMGIMAQDLQKYKCGKHILVEGEYEFEDETSDTILNINPYDMTMAVMGALKKEIEIREQENNELKAKNEELEKRLAKLEEMLLS